MYLTRVGEMSVIPNIVEDTVTTRWTCSIPALTDHLMYRSTHPLTHPLTTCCPFHRNPLQRPRDRFSRSDQKLLEIGCDLCRRRRQRKRDTTTTTQLNLIIAGVPGIELHEHDENTLPTLLSNGVQ